MDCWIEIGSSSRGQWSRNGTGDDHERPPLGPNVAHTVAHSIGQFNATAAPQSPASFASPRSAIFHLKPLEFIENKFDENEQVPAIHRPRSTGRPSWPVRDLRWASRHRRLPSPTARTASASGTCTATTTTPRPPFRAAADWVSSLQMNFEKKILLS